MSESTPRNAAFEAGMALQRQDQADPVRGPVMNMSRKVLRAAYESADENMEHPFLQEFETLQTSFRDQFADPEEAKRYRLYHFIIGSSPSVKADLFDADGEHSLAKKLRELAEKYTIDTGEV